MKTTFLIVNNNTLLLERTYAILQEYFSTCRFYKVNDVVSAIKFSKNMVHIDFLIVDAQIKALIGGRTKSGVDLVFLYRKRFAYLKVLILERSEKSLILYSIHKNVYPNGLLFKGDLSKTVILEAVEQMSNGAIYYSNKVKNAMKAIAEKEVLQQDYNIKILMLLNQGFKIREISHRLTVSIGMVNRRIAVLRNAFAVTDNHELLSEVKKQGFI